MSDESTTTEPIVEQTAEPIVESAEPIAEQTTEEAPIEAIVPRDRLTSVGLDRTRNGQFDYIDLTQPYGPGRQIVVDGHTFEHCSEDLDGVWLYRHSQF